MNTEISVPESVPPLGNVGDVQVIAGPALVEGEAGMGALPAPVVEPQVLPATTGHAKGRIPCIDGLRAFACLAVLSMHCFNYANQPSWRIPLGRFAPSPMTIFLFGNTGVHLFLLLSGFCLFMTFAQPGRDKAFKAKTFFVRRFWRIVPAYYATILLCLAWFPFCAWLRTTTGLMAYPDGKFPSLFSLLLHLPMLHALLPSTLFDINGPFWSLALECEFYLSFPFLVWSFHRLGPAVTITVLLAVTLAYRIVAVHFVGNSPIDLQWTVISANLPGRIAEFGLGMLAAWQVMRGQVHPWDWRIGLLMLAIAGPLALGGMKTVPFGVWNDLLWSLFYFCLILAAVGGMPLVGRLFSWPVLQWIGERSYSVYLIHLPLLVIVAAILKPYLSGVALFWALLAAMLPVALVVATFWYHLFERPFLRGMPAFRRPDVKPSKETAVAGRV